MSYAEDELSGRPRLSLQPRSSSGDQSSALPAKSSRPNPFGTARPREQVIAERTGKKETEVLKEQAQKEWKPSIVLTEAQREEKKAAEAELAFAKSELTQEFDPVKSKALKEEVAVKEKKLEELLGSFEKIAIQTAQTGGTRRPYERRRDEDRPQGGAVPVPVAGNYSADGQDNYSSFSRGRERDADRGGSYGDTWGAKGGGGGMGGGMGVGGAGGRSGSSQCYKCGEMGHFSRECPNAGVAGGRGGSFGGNFGGGGGGRSAGGRSCYTCGQEGHFSRECPQGGGYARGSSGGVGGGYPAQSYGGGYGGGGYAPSDYEAAASYAAQGGAGGYPSAGYDDRYGYGNVSGAGGAGGYPAGNRWDGYPRN